MAAATADDEAGAAHVRATRVDSSPFAPEAVPPTDGQNEGLTTLLRLLESCPVSLCPASRAAISAVLDDTLRRIVAAAVASGEPSDLAAVAESGAAGGELEGAAEEGAGDGVRAAGEDFGARGVEGGGPGGAAAGGAAATDTVTVGAGVRPRWRLTQRAVRVGMTVALSTAPRAADGERTDGKTERNPLLAHALSESSKSTARATVVALARVGARARGRQCGLVWRVDVLEESLAAMGVTADVFAGVNLASVIEYVAAEWLDLALSRCRADADAAAEAAGDAAPGAAERCISPEHVLAAYEADSELRALWPRELVWRHTLAWTSLRSLLATWSEARERARAEPAPLPPRSSNAAY
eukprot:CAMPEP_0203808906 /NCGR_PEP_ID=MMETSP0115-20131106/1897_1 /ASSEMBLY_ACC=CAM_ASM_000227 /TAXON_ID=33651 /ORGANISM="Bicosoecid sp, Strain ms1" /LENGTH=354 /DNA_ID=CAMNT_0050717611 /DNA_START=116 /DNA_END=1177 /DNA_ORIENTATION=-